MRRMRMEGACWMDGWRSWRGCRIVSVQTATRNELGTAGGSHDRLIRKKQLGLGAGGHSKRKNRITQDHPHVDDNQE